MKVDKRRPYWLIGFLALAAAANVVGLAGRIADLPLDAELEIAFPPWLGIVHSAVWALIFAVLAVAMLWRKRVRAAVLWAALLATGYALIGLLMLLAFARSDYDRGRSGAEVAVSVTLLAPIWWRALRRNRSAERTGQKAA